MKTTTTSLFLAGSLLSGGVAYGNAFNVNEHDAASSGRGGATAATNTSASSVVFNPGGIPVGEGTQVAINGSLYITQGFYEPEGGGAKVKTDTSPVPVPAIYLTSRVHDMVGVGVALHFPFGASISWPDGHPQRATLTDQTLRTFFITPSVGINLDKQVPGLSFGGGLDLVPATVLLKRAVVFGDTEGTAELGGDAFGIGGRGGIMYRPPAVKQLSLGVMYRSQVTLDFEGKGDFDIAQPYRDQLPPDGDITTTIVLPQQVWAGVAVRPIPQLELELDGVWIDWSAFKELRINLPADQVTVAPQNYEDKITVRFGAEYDINEQAAVRAGFVYDPTPIPDTTQSAQLPDANRINVALGGSYKFTPDYGLHLGFLWVTPQDRETSDDLYSPTYKGTYGVQAFVASLMFSATFGGKAAPDPMPDPVVAKK
jgi:long-chain fatty acid transport protein